VVTVLRAELEAHDFPPFVALKDELMAMTCHVVFTAIDPDNPATTSKIVVDEIIRDFIGFKGLLLSDDTSMNALKGTIGERAANIIAGGCDIVLHCNGVMDEMQQVVRNVPLLAGAALERTKAVEAAFGRNDGADEATIRAEFDAMLAAA
jgi:beta-N-acetylhexosaminidase